MLSFVAVTLSNAGLLLAAAILGGAWAWAALLYISLFTAFMDRFVARLTPEMTEGAEFPSGAVFSVGLGVLHIALLLAAIHGLSNTAMSLPERLATFVAFSLFFGQVSHPNAHELIHRSARFARRLGRIVYGTLLYGHHASTHVLIHHAHVGTDKDPCTARKGEGFYRYFLRVWRAVFVSGLRAENARSARAASGPRLHPYLLDLTVAVVTLASAVWIGGAAGLVALLALALYAQLQIAMADYVQHYGLTRRIRANGKPEPVGPQHSWNTPHWYSSALMLNAPRHSDHHLNPQRPYPALTLDEETMPTLPHSLPVMATIALFPPLYRRVMKRELANLPDEHSAA